MEAHRAQGVRIRTRVLSHAESAAAVLVCLGDERIADPHTAERVSELCPLRPGIAGVTRVRPVSALATGECYAILADGRFERRRLHPFTPHQPAPQRIESTGRSPHDPTRHR